MRRRNARDRGFCPACGRPMHERARARPVGALPENVAGALAYFTFIPAIVFLSRPPYKKNRFLRFHSLQCLLLCGILIGIAL